VVELANGHVGSNVLTHRDESDSDDCETLVQVILLLGVNVVVAVVEHVLDLEDISGPGERAHVDEDEGLLSDRRLYSLERLDRRI
jgi:hypothetical protein